jgi:GAF domain-containing protein
MHFPLPSNESERLESLHRLAILDTPSSPAIDRLCRITKQVLDVPAVYVTLLDQHRQRIKAGCGASSGIDLPREHVFCNYTILHDEVFVVPDAHADQTFAPNPYVVGEPHIRFYAGVPLTIKPGIRLGALCVTDSKPRDLCPEKAALLRGLGRLVVGELWLHYLDLTGQAVTQEVPSSAMDLSFDFETPSYPTSDQIRAARGLLNWSSQELANAAGVSLASIKRIETLGETSVRRWVLSAVVQAFERQGVRFTRKPEGLMGVERMGERAVETRLSTGATEHGGDRRRTPDLNGR